MKPRQPAPPAPPAQPTYIGDAVTVAILRGVRGDVAEHIDAARRSLQRALEKAERANAPEAVTDAIRGAIRAADDVQLPIGIVSRDGHRWL